MSPVERSAGGGASVAGVGSSSLIYRYTVAGVDKASIDTGVDAADAGSNDWTNGDLLEIWLLTRTDEAAAAVTINVTLNNDGSAVYDLQVVTGANAAATAGTALAQTAWVLRSHGSGGSASYPSVTRFAFPAFAGTTFFKVAESVSARVDATAANDSVQAVALGYRSASAITRFAVAATAAQKLKVGSQLSIYKRTAS